MKTWEWNLNINQSEHSNFDFVKKFRYPISKPIEGHCEIGNEIVCFRVDGDENRVHRTYHVDGEFTEIGIQLTWESEASGNTGHGGGDQIVQITIGWGGEFECSELVCYFWYSSGVRGTQKFGNLPEADIVKSFVIDTIGLVCVFNQLMD